MNQREQNYMYYIQFHLKLFKACITKAVAAVHSPLLICFNNICMCVCKNLNMCQIEVWMYHYVGVIKTGISFSFTLYVSSDWKYFQYMPCQCIQTLSKCFHHELSFYLWINHPEQFFKPVVRITKDRSNQRLVLSWAVVLFTVDDNLDICDGT